MGGYDASEEEDAYVYSVLSCGFEEGRRGGLENLQITAWYSIGWI